ncbi:MAG: DUF2974 domain-containing protein [Alphaproteobacteria bacterium]|nr:DUF2974 domain-containing protein [Alphaproteobacteria bacterium]
MSEELFNAILSMDSYNRGYGQGIILSETTDSLNLEIGKYIIVRESDIASDDEGVNISFYAIAYKDTASDAITISYRGTDDVVWDPWYGWGVGRGSPYGEQAEMAIKFYQAVAGDGHWLDANISLTGHSLGGGLAGLVGTNDNARRNGCNKYYQRLCCA